MEKMKSSKKGGFMDNRKVNDTHQRGIERVKQRPGDMEKGQPGKMGKGDKANWTSRSAGTPKTA